ncbi:peptidoglycan DD-metalloendopeptidase family protein [Nitrosomonas sp. Nm33]|uniref:peptidoglycan DD-metalloendopeptidase family protein n=1 Tax=Nitrosomonas sp. Nm33 TaxID=133724 RepID=UPI00089CED57|nr:peptidoglycan DD-metalloendopeptidase family protein [Nitrosomonas sp. Nm33]SDY97775.1 lipoprotein NlpD [Nitrosomonas sp. Nm33]
MLDIMIRKACLEIYGVITMAILVVRSKLFTILSGVLLVFPYFLITGCVAPHPAPVVESQRNLNQAIDKAPAKQIYIVQKGDTLYAVALRHGIDYKELAQWNGIVNPNALKIGQEIDLSVPSRQKLSSQQEKVIPEQVVTAQPTLFSVPQPILSSERAKQLPSSASQAGTGASASSLVAEPKGVKLPYSETAVAQLRGSNSTPNSPTTPPKAETVAIAPVIQKSEMASTTQLRGSDSTPNSPTTPPKAETVAIAPVTQKSEMASTTQKIATAPTTQKIVENESTPKSSPQKLEANRSNNIKWSWPTNGQLLSRYTEKSKGVTIAGKPGQSVLASADGTVVYSGSGLRGYGKLIIVKHNNTYLSAYGHNSKILVREGETVTKGQKIAEMGNTDSDTVKLHFEIRERGKPVDPLKFLSN